MKASQLPNKKKKKKKAKGKEKEALKALVEKLVGGVLERVDVGNELVENGVLVGKGNKRMKRGQVLSCIDQ